MICKHYDHKNNADTNSCGGCGRNIVQTSASRKKIFLYTTACLLILALSVGILISKDSPAPVIKQVLPMKDGSVTVLYSDGIVRVSGNSALSDAVSGWKNVEKLYYDTKYEWTDTGSYSETVLLGLTGDGTLLTTNGTLSDWTNIKEIHVTYQSTIGITQDGNVLMEGDAWDDPDAQAALSAMTDVETLICSDLCGYLCLKKDGTVYCIMEYGYPEYCVKLWDNVKEIRCSGHAFYAIRNDGTVVHEMDSVSCFNLTNAVKIVHYNDNLFGLSADGRLLTHDGGNIYTNTGDMVVKRGGSPFYGGEVDVNQFNQVKDIFSCWGLILLNQDGTATAIGEYPTWDLSSWNNIQTVKGCYAFDNYLLYGIREDGSVIRNQYNLYKDTQITTDHYRSWNLKDIYVCSENGAVGLTSEGKLVGDGLYDYLDFTVFDR